MKRTIAPVLIVALLLPAALFAQDGGVSRAESYNRVVMAADVLRFLDWLIALPGELDALYLEEVQAMQEDSVVAYVTSWERIGEKRGVALGVLQEKRQILERLIDRKFGAAPTDHDLIIRCDDPDRLDTAVDTVLVATTKDEVLQHIR